MRLTELQTTARQVKNFVVKNGRRIIRKIEPVGGRVFFYHHIVPSPCIYTQRLDICIDPTAFAEQIEYLTSNFEVVPFSKILRNPLKRNMVAITFDDGYSSFAEQALPILERYKCPAKIFLNASQTRGELGWLNKTSALLVSYADRLPEVLLRDCIPEWFSLGKKEVPNMYFFWNEFSLERSIPAIEREFAQLKDLPPASDLFLSKTRISDLAKHPLLEWGSHSARHYPLNALDPEELEREVSGGHFELRELLGEKLQGFSVPFGTGKFRTRYIANAVRAVDDHFVTATCERMRLRYVGGLREVQRIEAPLDLQSLKRLLNVRR